MIDRACNTRNLGYGFKRNLAFAAYYKIYPFLFLGSCLQQKSEIDFMFQRYGFFWESSHRTICPSNQMGTTNKQMWKIQSKVANKGFLTKSI